MTNAPNQFRRNVLRFIKLITTTNGKLGKDEQDIAWLGSPVVPEQMLVRVQLEIHAKEAEWNISQSDPLVNLIATIWHLNRCVRLYIEAIARNKQSRGKVECSKLLEARRSTRIEARLQNVASWKGLYEMANAVDLNDILDEQEI